MKALVTTLAFGAAVGLTALIVTIQQDPFTFTRMSGTPKLEPTAEPVGVLPVTVSAIEEATPSAPAAVTLEEVRIEARPSPPARRAAAPEPELIIPEIVPAPCVHGEYRKLEPNRGVYLICPQGKD
jgi:hypothetical protein